MPCLGSWPLFRCIICSLSFWLILVNGRHRQRRGGWEERVRIFLPWLYSTLPQFSKYLCPSSCQAAPFTVAAVTRLWQHCSVFFRPRNSHDYLFPSPWVLYYPSLAPYPCSSINYVQSHHLDMPSVCCQDPKRYFSFLDKSDHLSDLLFCRL